MPNNKKHHYIPRFYLKKFSVDKKSICLYNLPKELKVVGANLKNQCYKNYFYGKDLKTETALSGIEGEVSQLYKEIEKHCTLPPPFSDQHILLIISILVQHGRTKYNADAMDDMHNKMFQHVFKEKMEAEIEGLNLNDYIVGIQNIAQYSIGIFIQYYPLLLDLGYKLILNNTKVDFMTSDNPVVMFNQLLSFRKLGSNTGLSSKGLQIFFPLSPDKLIIIYDSSIYRVGGERKTVFEITNERDVYNLNALQACSCYENIYFSNDDHDITSLHRKVRPFLRQNMSQMGVFPEYDHGKRKSEIIINYREDICFYPNLSFLSIRKSARKWCSYFQKQASQPALVMRNKSLHDDAKEFADKVKENEYDVSEFVKFLAEKYEWDKQTNDISTSLPTI
ncbi:MAG: DUF4238 domain-containing protein [Candidatus Sedimenticola sp. (ex Thyasira tokunagai)]